LKILKNEIKSEKAGFEGLVILNPDELTPKKFDLKMAGTIRDYLAELNLHYLEIFTSANRSKNNRIRNNMENQKDLYYSMLDKYYNESVSDAVRKIFERKKIVEYNSRLIQKIDPVFLDPNPSSPIDFRSHFYAPQKYLFGKYFDTYWFNMSVIWFLTLILYGMLYYDLFRKLIHFSFSHFRFRGRFFR
jgi:hypothetical protein